MTGRRTKSGSVSPSPATAHGLSKPFGLTALDRKAVAGFAQRQPALPAQTSRRGNPPSKQ
jgi:hypothetical protein